MNKDLILILSNEDLINLKAKKRKNIARSNWYKMKFYTLKRSIEEERNLFKKQLLEKLNLYATPLADRVISTLDFKQPFKEIELITNQILKPFNFFKYQIPFLTKSNLYERISKDYIYQFNFNKSNLIISLSYLNDFKKINNFTYKPYPKLIKPKYPQKFKYSKLKLKSFNPNFKNLLNNLINFSQDKFILTSSLKNSNLLLSQISLKSILPLIELDSLPILTNSSKLIFK